MQPLILRVGPLIIALYGWKCKFEAMDIDIIGSDPPGFISKICRARMMYKRKLLRMCGVDREAGTETT